MPTDRAIAADRALPRSASTAPSWRFDRLGASLAKLIAVAFVLLWSLGPIALIAVAAFTPERDIFAVGASAGWRPLKARTQPGRNTCNAPLTVISTLGTTTSSWEHGWRRCAGTGC